MKVRKILAMLIPVFAVCYFGIASPAITRPKFYTVVELTRNAKLIVVGSVARLLPKSIVVKVDNQIKGATNKPEVEVLWDYAGNIEQRPPALAVGERVLLFLVPGESVYEPVGASQGLFKIGEPDIERYRFVIQKIIDFDAAPDSPVLRRNFLRDLLMSPESTAQLAALEIIYLEFQNQTFPTASLIKPVLALARNNNAAVAVNAIQVLSRIGDKTVIPELIRLLRSPDRDVADTAGDALKTMTGEEIEFADLKTSQERTKAITRWQEWWRRSKGKVVLNK